MDLCAAPSARAMQEEWEAHAARAAAVPDAPELVALRASALSEARELRAGIDAGRRRRALLRLTSALADAEAEGRRGIARSGDGWHRFRLLRDADSTGVARALAARVSLGVHEAGCRQQLRVTEASQRSSALRLHVALWRTRTLTDAVARLAGEEQKQRDRFSLLQRRARAHVRQGRERAEGAAAAFWKLSAREAAARAGLHSKLAGDHSWSLRVADQEWRATLPSGTVTALELATRLSVESSQCQRRWELICGVRSGVKSITLRRVRELTQAEEEKRSRVSALAQQAHVRVRRAAAAVLAPGPPAAVQQRPAAEPPQRSSAPTALTRSSVADAGLAEAILTQSAVRLDIEDEEEGGRLQLLSDAWSTEPPVI